MAEIPAPTIPGRLAPGRRRADKDRRTPRGPRPAGSRAPTHRENTRRFRRTRGLPGTLAITFLGAVFPGFGFVWTGRRLLGLAILTPLALGAAWASWHYGNQPGSLLELAVSPTWLRVTAVALVVGTALWVATVYLTYRQARPSYRPRWHTVAGHLFVLVLCLALAAPAAMAARYATVQADLVTTVFDDHRSATTPRGVTRDDPWAGQDRVNVLLLGGDGGEGRSGVRTDTVILMSTDTHNGRTVMFSLPRNMMLAQFPEDSPLHDLYPDGYTGYDDPGYYMLNAIYGQIPSRHPGILGESDNEGADALKQAVEGSLGIPVDYYLLVNLKGFEQVVDAIGGVTVNINEPVAIQGNTDLGIPPTGYLQPGPDQHLDGFHALWFARGRWGSDDYERMNRQRCMIDALIEAADPVTLIRNYQDLASAGKEVVYTDISLEVLPAFVELAWRVKDARVKSVVFETSERFSSASPDFEWMREVVQRNLLPKPGGGDGPDDPGRARSTATSCAYQPAL